MSIDLRKGRNVSTTIKLALRPDEDDMANELEYIRSSQRNGGIDPFGRKLTADELLMIGIIEE